MSSKFLEILEQHDPKNESILQTAWFVKNYLYESNVSFSSKGTEITLHTPEGDILLEVKGKGVTADAEEDENINAGTGTYEVDSEVEKLGDKASKGMKGLAGKLFKTKAQRAKSAVKERQNVAGQAVDAYRKGTDRLKKGLQAVKTSATQQTY